MTSSNFPTFVAFLTSLAQKRYFPAPEAEGGDLTGRRKSVSEVTMFSRRRLPNRRGHELLNFEHDGIRYTAGTLQPCQPLRSAPFAGLRSTISRQSASRECGNA
jgi:hypothetical protein